MGYYVSRQSYYYSGEKVVEIESGGLDYSGSDTLVERYSNLGEGQEFDDPREAVRAAIAIRDAWRRDEPDESIHISYGQTSGGMGFEHEPDYVDDDKAATEWAEKEWAGLPKCERCGEILSKDKYNLVGFPDAGEFCSSYCAEEEERAIAEANTVYVIEHMDEWQWWDQNESKWVDDPQAATGYFGDAKPTEYPDHGFLVPYAEAKRNFDDLPNLPE